MATSMRIRHGFVESPVPLKPYRLDSADIVRFARRWMQTKLAQLTGIALFMLVWHRYSNKTYGHRFWRNHWEHRYEDMVGEA